MKDEEKEISEGLNQIFEVINAKGDLGEIHKILDQPTLDPTEKKLDAQSHN